MRHPLPSFQVLRPGVVEIEPPRIEGPLKFGDAAQIAELKRYQDQVERGAAETLLCDYCDGEGMITCHECDGSGEK